LTNKTNERKGKKMAVMTSWRPNPNVAKRQIAGKDILITVKRNRLLLLNKQASAIWDCMANRKDCTEQEIANELKGIYPESSLEELQRDTRDFLEYLAAKGFVQNGSNYKMIDLGQVEGKTSGHFLFSEKIHEVAVKQGYPVSCGLEVTQRCPLRCQHCYIDGVPIVKESEMTTEEMHDFLVQIAVAGCLWLLVTGGEPLCRKDFPEIYKHAKELGMIVTVFTSATTLTEKIVELFEDYPPFLVESTLHSADKRTFDRITQVDGSYRRFIKGINLLRESGIPFNLKMIVMRLNSKDVSEALQLASTIGADDFRFDAMINADFANSEKVQDLRISVEEAIALDLAEPFWSRWEKVYQNAFAQNPPSRKKSDFLFPCRAGKCSFAVSASGKLMPCILMRAPSYDLKKEKFSEQWKKLNRYVLKERMRNDNPCLDCSVQTCSKCPAWGYLEKGDPNIKSPFACALEKEREKAFLFITKKS